ncbi:MAG: hypothetical protein ACI9FB_001423 [Candidatus Azotimanducaceae bacterium]
MKYEINLQNDKGIMLLKLQENVDYRSLQACFLEVNETLRYNFYLRLLIDGDEIDEFNIPNKVCQQMAPQLFGFSRRAAFFSYRPVVFGMLRVIEASSFNDKFSVFKEEKEARRFLALRQVRAQASI